MLPGYTIYALVVLWPDPFQKEGSAHETIAAVVYSAVYLRMAPAITEHLNILGGMPQTSMRAH